MTTPIDIAELERLEREATVGPWSACKDPHHFSYHERDHRTHAVYGAGLKILDACRPQDGSLIDVSRNALPELIASLKIAVEALKKYRGIAGSDCANSVTQYSVADEALAEIQKRVTYE